MELRVQILSGLEVKRYTPFFINNQKFKQLPRKSTIC